MIELMAPAGNFAAMQAAVDAGANSVYFGVEQLSMRARSTMNFTLDDLDEVVERCQPKNVKTYITLNTIIYDHDLGLAKKIVDKAVKAGITAVIASDQAVIQYAKSKGMPVHISTQLNVTNIETVKFYSLFADVMVLSRELSVRQVQKIVEAVKRDDVRGPSGDLVRIEIFGHGALCMAVSGKCYLSLHTQNSSANRGACIQNCRRKYRVIDIEGGHELEIDNEYIMSPKDLCTLDFLDQVIATGVGVLKIEGRGRAPEYVKTVIECYREAIDAYYEGTYNQEKIDAWMARLAKVYNRGFWSGYYLGQEMGEWTKKHGSSAQQKKVFLGKGIHYYPKAKVAHFQIDSYSLSVGDKVVIIGPTTGVVETEITELMVDSKQVTEATRGMDCTFPLEQLIRKSDKLYKLVEVEVEA
ncbi:peptidase U32 family protein [Aureispira anguillae]|uniref:U32 family peptidase n=1 Tax=Aureispira anguillae TaxID=2864201 RepID=A0A915YCN5_9BACT|nr:peptidase U32 family protein [Aureispira anguillae]BDS10635.1 U32 family peptidase [Aureispira anguillae]